LNVAEILNKAADLIEPEGRWTQDGYAKDVIGRDIYPDDPSAVCFCALGAIARAGGFDPDIKPDHPAVTTLHAAVGEWVPVWNDQPERTQAEVVAALREAAKMAEEKL
jgi:hypothetical protein